MTRIKTGKDFWSGIMFLLFAVASLYFSRNHSLGSSGEMGPRYFPVVLGVLLGGIGLLLIARAILNGDEAVEGFGLRAITILVIGVVLFGFCIQPLGLVISTAITVVTVALADRGSRPVTTGLLALALIVLSVGVFHFALQLPLPVWPSL
jgi:hypothetical protein